MNDNTIPCATRDCDRPSAWYTIREGNIHGNKAPRRCRQCCNAIDEAFRNVEGTTMEEHSASEGPPEHSDRARYVTDQVATWIVNDGDYYEWARGRLPQDRTMPEEFGRELANIIRRAPMYSAPWQVAQELAPNDYGRIDWREVAHQLSD